MKALVTGAPGFVGSQMCRELLSANYQVRALHRQSSNLDSLKRLPLELVRGDITDPPSLDAAMKDVDFVFHIAALYRQAKFPDSVYWKVNFDGTRNVLEAAKRQGVRRVIHCSTTGVHSHIKNPPAREDEPYAPTDVYQESKTEAEKLCLDWFRRGEIDGCVIRPAMIWGPADTRFLKMFRGIASRRMPIIGSGQSLCHWILVSDLARAFRLAAENPATTGQVYLIGGERVVTLEYTMATIARVYGVKLLPFKIPAWPVQVAGSIVETLCKPLGIEPPLHRRRADFFIKNRAFDCSKAREQLGFVPSHTFEDECELIARWYIDAGLIRLAHPIPEPPRMAA